MTKAELTVALANVLDIPQARAGRALDGVCAVLAEALKAGHTVALPGIGVLRVQDRPARTARNPRTGEPVPVPARKVVRFNASGVLAKAL